MPSYVAMDRATAWLRGNAEDATPFLLVYSCKEPHPPFGAPDPFRAMYRPDEVALPATRSDTKDFGVSHVGGTLVGYPSRVAFW